MSSVDISQFDQRAIISNAGYAAYKSIYETSNPQPQMPIVQKESLFIPVALTIMIIASVLVSGSRTVFEFGGGIVGVSAFVMLEGAIVAYAFFRTRINFSDERMESVRTLANRGLGLSFTVAVAANVHSVIKGAGIQTPPVITLLILILVAISAPTLAFISGDIMALELMRNAYRERKASSEYQLVLDAWHDNLNQLWARDKHKMLPKFEPMPFQQLSNGIPLESTGTQPSKSTLGHQKEPDASPIVLAYFQDNPDMLSNGKPLEIAKHLGVGKSTVYSVRSKLLQDKQDRG